MRDFEGAKRLFETDSQVQAILKIIDGLDLPDAWLVAGSVYRNLWNLMYDRPVDFTTDVDVAFFDAGMTYEASEALQAQVNVAHPEYDWEVKNQAVMHIRNGVVGIPYTSTLDAISKYPERSTGIGLRLDSNGEIEWLLPYGFDEIADRVVRPSPGFEDSEVFTKRRDQKRLDLEYPGVTYVD
jgi:hypothetical protein